MDIWIWMNELVFAYGYLGAFIVCIIGNVSIILPVPFALVVYAFGSTLNPLLLGIVAGIGSTIGEMSSYIVGRGGRRVIESRYGGRLDTVKKLVEKHGMLVIFLVALLPVPDDLLLIPLGMMKYPVKKLLFAMLLGKTGMCLFLAYAGAYSLSYFRDLYAAGGEIGVIATIVLLAVIIIALLKFDWTRFLDKPSE
jgi:membrane protein DedA with SNARE-associated domain